MTRIITPGLCRRVDRQLQNRERTGVPARAARVGWWMRPDHKLKLSGRSRRYRSGFCNNKTAAVEFIRGGLSHLRNYVGSLRDILVFGTLHFHCGLFGARFFIHGL
jgi:hypothetical protein